MMRPTHVALLVCGALVGLVGLVGCGGDDSGSASPSNGDLEGRTFVATDIVDGAIVDGTEITVTFDNGDIVVAAGCNTQRGGYALSGGKLVVDTLAGTMMACDEVLMAQDQLMTDLLGAEPTVTLDGDELTITSTSTTVVLRAR